MQIDNCKLKIDARRGAQKPAGFTLVEALVAMTLASLAGCALLTGVSAALQATQTSVEQTVGQQLAQRLMDEIAGQRYSAVGASSTIYPLAPGSGTTTRSTFTCMADYNGYRAEPAVDAWGVQIGRGNGQGGQRNSAMQAATYFGNWRQEVDVYYVDATDLVTVLSGGSTSSYRGVDVRIMLRDPVHGLRTVASLHRVFSYVPTP